MQDSTVLLSSALFVLPGFTAIALYHLLSGVRNRDFSRTILFSVAISLLSILILTIFSNVSKIGPIFNIDDLSKINLSKESKDSINLQDLAVSIAKIMITSIILVISYFLFHRKFDIENRIAHITGFTSSPDVWQDFYRLEGCCLIRVYTNSNEIFVGQFHSASEEGQKRGLVLTDVQKVDDNGDHSSIYDPPLKTRVLFLEEDIRRLVQVIT